MKTLLLLSLVCIALVSAQDPGPQGQKGETGDVGSPGAPGTCSGSCSGGGGTVRACCVYLKYIDFGIAAQFGLRIYIHVFTHWCCTVQKAGEGGGVGVQGPQGPAGPPGPSGNSGPPVR